MSDSATEDPAHSSAAMDLEPDVGGEKESTSSTPFGPHSTSSAPTSSAPVSGGAAATVVGAASEAEDAASVAACVRSDFLYFLPTRGKAWAFVQSLLTPLMSVDRYGIVLEACAEHFHRRRATGDEQEVPQYKRCLALKTAVRQWKAEDPSLDIDALLQFIATLALRLADLFPEGTLQLLVRNQQSAQRYTPEQTACLLANGFFGTLQPYAHQHYIRTTRRATHAGAAAAAAADSASQGDGEHAWYFPADAVPLGARLVHHEKEGEIVTGSLHLLDVIIFSNPQAVQRVKALLWYFHALQNTPALLSTTPAVAYERHVGVAEMFTRKFWTVSHPRCNVELKAEHVQIHAGDMYDQSCDAIVDYANRYLMINHIAASCTQEEVLFSARPDLLVSLLLADRLEDSEVVVMRGCPWYIYFEGYLQTIRAARLLPVEPGAPVPAIIAMDSLINRENLQYSEPAMTRDMAKAYVGFASAAPTPADCITGAASAGTDGPVISTGLWGCGIFANDPVPKFLQQWLAAEMSGTRLLFSTFKNERLRDLLIGLRDDIAAHGVTAAQLFAIMASFRVPVFGTATEAFYNHIRERVAAGAYDQQLQAFLRTELKEGGMGGGDSGCLIV